MNLFEHLQTIPGNFYQRCKQDFPEYFIPGNKVLDIFTNGANKQLCEKMEYSRFDTREDDFNIINVENYYDVIFSSACCQKRMDTMLHLEGIPILLKNKGLLILHIGDNLKYWDLWAGSDMPAYDNMSLDKAFAWLDVEEIFEDWMITQGKGNDILFWGVRFDNRFKR